MKCFSKNIPQAKLSLLFADLIAAFTQVECNRPWAAWRQTAGAERRTCVESFLTKLCTALEVKAAFLCKKAILVEAWKGERERESDPLSGGPHLNFCYFWGWVSKSNASPLGVVRKECVVKECVVAMRRHSSHVSRECVAGMCRQRHY